MACQTHSVTNEPPVGPAQTMEVDKIGHHARLTYLEVQHHGDPVDPDLELIPPKIYRAKRRPRIKILMDDGSTRDEYVYLMQEDGTTPPPSRAYRRIPKKPTVKVKYGHVLFAIQLNHVRDNIYQCTDTKVAIKKLHKVPFQIYLERGGRENPYNAISRMQTIGDDDHVLSCIDAFENDKYLYSVMPYCEGKSLSDIIPWDQPGATEYDAMKIYHKILKNVHYLQSHNICHHDLSPDNILLLRGNLVFCDLAMSLIVPNGNSHRKLMTPQGPFGKPPYWTPEVLVSQTPFDAYQLDVWASGCIYYNLLTTQRLFCQPHPSDISFRYFIMKCGLSNQPMNHNVVEFLIDTAAEQESLVQQSVAHLQLSQDSLVLLQGVLQMNPRDRWTLANCIEWLASNMGPM